MTEAPALKRAKREKEAHGEIETEHPGYLGAQDKYYIDTLKSVGRVLPSPHLAKCEEYAGLKISPDRPK